MTRCRLGALFNFLFFETSNDLAWFGNNYIFSSYINFKLYLFLIIILSNLMIKQELLK